MTGRDPVELYLEGEPQDDVWVSETRFQCDWCNDVFPEWMAARTENGTLVCQTCLDIGF